MTAPDRGDLIILNMQPQRGREQAKRRPALVLSPAPFNRVFGVAFIAPITSRESRNPFEIELPPGLGVHGSVLAHQLKALDWSARHSAAAGHAPADIVDRVADIVNEIVSQS